MVSHKTRIVQSVVFRCRLYIAGGSIKLSGRKLVRGTTLRFLRYIPCNLVCALMECTSLRRLVIQKKHLSLSQLSAHCTRFLGWFVVFFFSKTKFFSCFVCLFFPCASPRKRNRNPPEGTQLVLEMCFVRIRDTRHLRCKGEYDMN